MQANELQVVSQLIVSDELKSYELRVYGTVSQRVESLPHCELRANKLARCKPENLVVASLQIINLEGSESIFADIK